MRSSDRCWSGSGSSDDAFAYASRPSCSSRESCRGGAPNHCCDARWDCRPASPNRNSMKPVIGLDCISGAAETTTDLVSGAGSSAENSDCADAMFDTDSTKLPSTTERHIDSRFPFHSTPRVKGQRHNRLVNCRKPRSVMVNDGFLRRARKMAAAGYAGPRRHSGSSEQPVRYGEMSNEKLVNGSRLDGESGHASQRDIDVMFA